MSIVDKGEEIFLLVFVAIAILGIVKVVFLSNKH